MCHTGGHVHIFGIAFVNEIGSLGLALWSNKVQNRDRDNELVFIAMVIGTGSIEANLG